MSTHILVPCAETINILVSSSKTGTQVLYYLLSTCICLPDATSVSRVILITLGLQIAQSRPYLHTLGPKVGFIYIHGALGL